MRIAIDVRHLTKPHPSGVGEYTIELLRALFALETSHQYTLFSAGSKTAWNTVPKFTSSQVQHIHIPVPNRFLNASFAVTGRPRLDQMVFGPIKDRRGGNLPLFFFPNLFLGSLPSDVPYVLTLHDLSFDLFPHYYSRKSRLWHAATRPIHAAQHARTVIVPSACTAEDVAARFGVPESRIRVIPHGASSLFHPKQAPEDHGVRSRLKLPKRYVLFVGTLERRKNIRALVEAVGTYRKETGDDLTLVLVGRQTAYSRDLFSSLPVEHKNYTKILGYVDAGDRPALYRLATATVFPSIYEGFGLPVLESMMSGTPVITSHTSALPEIGGEAAVYVNPLQPGDIAHALRELLTSQTLQKRLRERGIAHASAFSWARCAKETLAVFEA